MCPATIPPGRRRLRWIVVAAVAIAVAWCALAAVSLVRAKRSADRGLAILREARGDLTATDMLEGTGLDQFQRAQAQLRRARSSARTPLLVPFEVLPVLGRQVRSVRALTASAAQVVGVGADAMRASRAELGQPVPVGPVRVQVVDRLGVIAGGAAAELRDVDLGPGDALLGSLASARGKFATDLDQIRTALTDAHSASVGLGALLRGPSTYLVFAANNGEMRSGSGMWLSVGQLTFAGGRFTLGEMSDTGDLALPPGAVPVTGDLAARWGWAQPNVDFRNLAMSPVFPANAQLAAAMWKARTGTDVDGVLVLDPVALQALLQAEGPVSVDGKTIGADDVVHELLYDQYVDFGDQPEAVVARRDRLKTIARAAIGSLDSHSVDLAKLVDSLRGAAEGRHLLAWSPHPAQQQAWEASGIAGELRPTSVMVSSMNISGNKLDQFVTITGDVTTAPAPNGGTAVTLHLDVVNDAPPDAPTFVQGPFPGIGLVAGEYRGILSIDVPAAASGIGIDGTPPLVAAGADGSAIVRAFEYDLARGARQDFTVRFTLPEGARSLRIEPSARAPEITWTAGTQRWSDDTARTLAW